MQFCNYSDDFPFDRSSRQEIVVYSHLFSDFRMDLSKISVFLQLSSIRGTKYAKGQR
jgi:hypothetical protein